MLNLGIQSLSYVCGHCCWLKKHLKEENVPILIVLSWSVSVYTVCLFRIFTGVNRFETLYLHHWDYYVCHYCLGVDCIFFGKWFSWYSRCFLANKILTHLWKLTIHISQSQRTYMWARKLSGKKKFISPLITTTDLNSICCSYFVISSEVKITKVIFPIRYDSLLRK